MRRSTLGLFLILAASSCASSQTEPSCPKVSAIEADFAEGTTQLVVRDDQLTWLPCPPTLPTDCEMAVLEGDPKREMLFTVRFRVRESLEMMPHWHPRNERVTILGGKVGVGFGDEVDRERVTWFGPGDYYVNAMHAHHFVLTDGPAELQITGIGPWKVNYLD